MRPTDGASRTRLEALLTSYRSDPSPLLRKTRDRLGGLVIASIRYHVGEYSQWHCVVCEQLTISDSTGSHGMELGHLIPASDYAPSGIRAGFVIGNLATMCKACNSRAGSFPFDKHLETIRCDWVSLEWPDAWRKRGVLRDEHADTAFIVRRNKGLPF